VSEGSFDFGRGGGATAAGGGRGASDSEVSGQKFIIFVFTCFSSLVHNKLKET